MRNINFKWKHCLLLFTVLVMAVTLVAGCAPEEAGGEVAGGEVEEKPTIVFSDNQYESNWIENAILIFIIEKGYGYPTEQVVVSTPVLLASIAKGDLHIMTEMWHQNYPEWWDEQISAGSIEPLTEMLEGGPQFWCIPQWVHEEYNINTVDDMKEHWELFKDPADPTKGLFVNSIIGWQCTAINEVKLEAYGLTEYYNSITTTAGALEAALAGPQEKHQAVFGYYWAPTALMGMYDWYILEEPEYDPDVWAKVSAAVDDESLRPVDEACAYESIPLPLVIHKSLRPLAPDVVAMLEKVTLGLERCNKTAAWCVENEIQEYEKAAVWFLGEYEDVWKTWVTNDAYTKIKTALDAYGPVP